MEVGCGREWQVSSSGDGVLQIISELVSGQSGVALLWTKNTISSAVAKSPMEVGCYNDIRACIWLEVCQRGSMQCIDKLFDIQSHIIRVLQMILESVLDGKWDSITLNKKHHTKYGD